MENIKKDIKEISKFVEYLDSDKEKYKINYKHLFEPYTYSKEISDFIMFWNESKLFRVDYIRYFDNRKNFEMDNINHKSTNFICYAITYFIRRERFSNGLLANNLDKLKELLQELVIRLNKYKNSSV